MRVIIHSVPTDLLVQTVSLTLDKDNPDNTFLFRCYHCGTAIGRVKGRMVSVVPGIVPTFQVPVFNQCYNCHENYIFQTTISNRKETALTLSPEPNRVISTFHCILCRTQLIQYNEKVVVSLPEYKPLSMPYSFECFKEDCKKNYLLNDVVTL